MGRKNIRWREGNKVVLYRRVSTDEQARDAYGLESQEKSCREFCRKRGWQIIAVFTDEGVSGWEDVERADFRRMMSFLAEHREVANLVFYDYSRFGRHTQRALTAFDKLDNLGVLSVAADNSGIDCRTAPGRTARRDELSKAEDFSDRNSEKTQERMRVAFEDGRYLRQAPLGYLNVRRANKGDANLVPDPDRKDFVRKAFELMATGQERASVVLQTLTDMGMRSVKGNKLTLQAFLCMLRRPVYIGQQYSQTHKKTVKGLWEPIVDEHTFRNVQLVLKGKKPSLAPYKRQNPEFPLRGLVRCASCSSKLTAAFCKSETQRKYPYYWCYKCKAVKSKDTKNGILEQELMRLLERLSFNWQAVDVPAIVKRVCEQAEADNTATIRQVNAELRETKQRQERLLLRYLDNDKNILPIFEQMNSKFTTDIAELEGKLADAQAAGAMYPELLTFSETMLTNIAEAWKQADVSQKQRVQNILFPNGIFFDSSKRRFELSNECLFNDLEELVAGKVTLARPERFELPTF